MSFGYSLSDIALGVKIVGTAVEALREFGGASSAYQELQRDLTDLQHVLQFLQTVHGKSDHGDLDTLNLIATRAKVSATRLNDFLKSTKKYDKSLSRPSRWSNAIPRKLQWGLLESRKVKTIHKRIALDMRIISDLQHTIFMYVPPPISTQKFDLQCQGTYLAQ